jgi:hypothetical protein
MNAVKAFSPLDVGTQLTATIAHSPGAVVEKTAKLVKNCLKGLNYIYGAPYAPRLSTFTARLVEGFDFLSLFDNLMYWTHDVTAKTIEKDCLLESFHRAILKHKLPSKQSDALSFSKDILNRLFENDYLDKKCCLQALKTALLEEGYTSAEADKIVSSVELKVKKTSIIDTITAVAFTIADVGSCLDIVKEWNIFNMASLAQTMGSQYRLLAFVVQIPLGPIAGAAASVGLTIVFIQCTADLIEKRDPKAFLNWLTKGLDLTAAVAGTVGYVNPPVLIPLAIVSKSLGLVCLFMKTPKPLF